ncbi:MAG: glycosyltransferase family 2 protein [Pseudomonadota bacterium]
MRILSSASGAVNYRDTDVGTLVPWRLFRLGRLNVQETSAPDHSSAPALVLLATHNGAPWLPEQLDSLLRQNHPALHIVVRDDASTDDTPNLLRRWCERTPGRVTLLTNHSDSAEGHRANFSALVTHALQCRDEPFVLFCDQDDIWHPNKVSVLLACMPESKEPALVFSDMRVLGPSDGPVAASFLRHQSLSARAPLPRLLVQNHVSGCASVVNRAALELAWPLPEAALIHDWWLALVCASAGTLAYKDQALLDYRQHGSNSIGAPGYNTRYLWQRAAGERRTGLRMVYAQAAALEARLRERGRPIPEALSGLLEIRGKSRFVRFKSLLSGGYTRSGWIRNLPLWFGRE